MWSKRKSMAKKILPGLVVLIMLSGCSGSDSDSSTGAVASPEASVPETPPASTLAITQVELSTAIDHVHGLVATDTDVVVAGTHSGARQVSRSGEVSAMGEQRDDLMGMTGEAGTQRLASSGHPGPGSPWPNPVGLITSGDGGTSWTPVSLQGEVDFHALAIDGERVVGYGSGPGLLVSQDSGETWQDGAQIQPAALAISKDRVLATTQSGLQVSTDAGASFSDVIGAPLLVFISAGTDTTVLGLDPDSKVWSSVDRGRTWTKVGAAPEAQAVAAAANGGGYAVNQESLYVVQ